MTNYGLERRVRLEADFNDVDERDRLYVELPSLTFAVRDPEPGQWVELHDEDGVVCWAVVEAVKRRGLICAVDRSTVQRPMRVSVPSGSGLPPTGLTGQLTGGENVKVNALA